MALNITAVRNNLESRRHQDWRDTLSGDNNQFKVDQIISGYCNKLIQAFQHKLWMKIIAAESQLTSFSNRDENGKKNKQKLPFANVHGFIFILILSRLNLFLNFISFKYVLPSTVHAFGLLPVLLVCLYGNGIHAINLNPHTPTHQTHTLQNPSLL